MSGSSDLEKLTVEDMEKGRPSDENGDSSQTAAPGPEDLEIAAPGEQAPEQDGNIEKRTPEETPENSNVVDWDGPDDPQTPYNWPMWIIITNTVLISASTFITPLASSIFAPGVPQLMQEFQSDSNELASFVVSVYLLGFAAGPMLIAPLSEIYGRVPVYHVCNVGFLAFAVACALAPTLSSLIGFRFPCGVFGSCPITNGGGSISDLVRQEKRGSFMAAFAMGPLVGPIVGPVAGGFLSAAKSWRWTFWLLSMLGGFVVIFEVLFLRETYAPVLLERKATRLRQETGNQNLRSKYDKGLRKREVFFINIIRPSKMLIMCPVVTLTTIFLALAYGYLYIMFTSVTYVFEEEYWFSTNIVGLVFLGLGIGSMAGVIYFSRTSDTYIRKKLVEDKAAAEAAGLPPPTQTKPEHRLPTLLVGSILMPAGFFIYGWTAQYRVHWIVPIIGTAVIGAGNIMLFMSISLYLVDAFTLFAASAVAANTVVRSVGGAVLPLCALQMYAALGLGWGNSLLAFIAIGMISIVMLIIRYGERLRERFPWKE